MFLISCRGFKKVTCVWGYKTQHSDEKIIVYRGAKDLVIHVQDTKINWILEFILCCYWYISEGINVS